LLARLENSLSGCASAILITEQNCVTEGEACCVVPLFGRVREEMAEANLTGAEALSQEGDSFGDVRHCSG